MSNSLDLRYLLITNSDLLIRSIYPHNRTKIYSNHLFINIITDFDCRTIEIGNFDILLKVCALVPLPPLERGGLGWGKQPSQQLQQLVYIP